MVFIIMVILYFCFTMRTNNIFCLLPSAYSYKHFARRGMKKRRERVFNLPIKCTLLFIFNSFFLSFIWNFLMCASGFKHLTIYSLYYNRVYCTHNVYIRNLDERCALWMAKSMETREGNKLVSITILSSI